MFLVVSSLVRPPGPFGFDTITNPEATIAIDDARITLDILDTTGNIDNIVVNAVATPEPASIRRLGTALTGIGVWPRRDTDSPWTRRGRESGWGEPSGPNVSSR